MKYYTDGSSRNNGKANAVGAYGFIKLIQDQEPQVYVQGSIDNVTNQRMELLAILAACQDSEPNDGFETVEIYSDSAYCINCMNQRWYDKWLVNGWVNSKKEPVANRDLWEKLIPYFNKANYWFLKVKGHETDQCNNYIDALVQAKSEELRRITSDKSNLC